MRLFIAVDLSQEARESIAAAQRQVIADAVDRSLRLVRPEHMHLTLAFMGAASDSDGVQIAQALGKSFEQESFRVSFGGLGIFPPRGNPRVLFVGIRDGLESLINLQRTIADRLEARGIPREARPFHPHLTLGRWRDGSHGDRRIAEKDIGVVGAVDVAEVALYQSQISSRGPAYTRLAVSKLT